jgi:hypothetical protein
MKPDFPPALVRPITLLAGTMDFCTGILLIAAPRLTCRLMGLTAVSDFGFLPFVGAFVAAIGSSYLWGLRRGNLRGTWEFTALVRGIIGAFVAISVASGTMAAGWLPVAATDLGLALLQIVFLRKGWVRDV